MDSPTGMGLSDLLDLQAVDLAIDRLLHQRQTLPELTRYQEAAGVRDRLEAARKAKAGELRSAELDLDKAEGELELVEIRLKEAETRLLAAARPSKSVSRFRVCGASRVRWRRGCWD